MAEKVAKAAGGNWGTAGTWTPEGVPVAGDDVILNATSGNVTIAAAGAVCRSLKCTGYTGILKHEAFTLTIGTTTAAPENKALVLVAGMTYTITNTSTSAISFTSTVAATVQTIDYAGKIPGNVTLNAAATSGYKLASAPGVSTASTLFLTQGSFDTGNFNTSFAGYQATSGNTKKFILGSSIVTSASNGGATNIVAAGTTMEAGTSTMRFTSASATPILGNGLTYNKIEFANSGTNSRNTIAASNLTCATLSFAGTNAGTNEYAVGPNLTVTGKLTAKGNTDGIRALISSCDAAGTATPGTKNKITAAEVSLENVDFMDIEGAGAAEWKGTRIGDCLGNSGITFDAPKTRYAVVAGSLTETKCWAEVSGGAGGKSIPLPQDTVIFNAASAAGTYTLNLPRLGAELDCTGFTRTLSVSVTSTIFGSRKFSSGMTLSGGQGMDYGGRSAHVLTSAGKTVVQTRIIGPGGTYAMTDDAVSSGVLFVNAGTLETGNFAIECSRLEHGIAVAAELKAGSSTITLTNAGCWVTSNAGFTMAANTATIKCSIAEPELRPGGVNFNGASWELLGTGTAKVALAGFTGVKLFRRTNAAACALQFASTFTFVAESWDFSGTAGNLVTVTASTAASAMILKKTSGAGVVSVDYVSLKDSKGEGGTTKWYAGPHSTLVSGNTGWKAEHPPATETAPAGISLAPAITPLVRTGHKLIIRARKVGGLGPPYPAVLKAALYEEGNNRSGNLVSGALTTALATYTLEISKEAAEAIVAYGNLEVRIWAYSEEGAQLYELEVADVKLELPAGAAGHTIELGRVSETDLAQSFARRKTTAIGQISEVDVAQAVSKLKRKAIAQATETDSAATATYRTTRLVGKTSEADSSQPLGRAKRAVLGQPVEIDLARAVAWAPKARLVGRAAEVDVAQTMAHSKRLAVAQALEADLSRPVTRVKARAIAQALESDVAGATSPIRTHAVGRALEADTASSLAHSKRKAIAQALEADTAAALAHSKRRAIAQALEVDAAAATEVRVGRNLGRVDETDLARPVTRVKAKVVGRASETDASRALVVARRLALGAAGEVDVGTPLFATKRLSIGEALENSSAAALRTLRILAVGAAAEADVARGIFSEGQFINVDRALEVDEALLLRLKPKPTGGSAIPSAGPAAGAAVGVGSSNAATIAVMDVGSASLGGTSGSADVETPETR